MTDGTVAFKISAMASTFVLSCVSSALPYWLVKRKGQASLAPIKRSLPILEMFAAGVFVGVSTSHLLPDAAAELPTQNVLPLQGFSFMFFTFSMGVVCTFLLESFSKGTVGHTHVALLATAAVKVMDGKGDASPGNSTASPSLGGSNARTGLVAGKRVRLKGIARHKHHVSVCFVNTHATLSFDTGRHRSHSLDFLDELTAHDSCSAHVYEHPGHENHHQAGEQHGGGGGGGGHSHSHGHGHGHGHSDGHLLLQGAASGGGGAASASAAATSSKQYGATAAPLAVAAAGGGPKDADDCDDYRHHHAHVSHHHHIDVTSGTTLIPFVLSLILSVHSLCAGFAMGMDNGPDWQLLIAILAHKWAESLTLAVSFVKENVSFAASIRMQLLYSLMVPLGIIVGMYLAKALSSDLGIAVRCLAQAYAAGSFMYVACMQILGSDMDGAPKTRCARVMRQYTPFLLGWGLMVLVSIWA